MKFTLHGIHFTPSYIHLSSFVFPVLPGFKNKNVFSYFGYDPRSRMHKVRRYVVVQCSQMGKVTYFDAYCMLTKQKIFLLKKNSLPKITCKNFNFFQIW